jgi:hypothetical protein
VEIRSQSHFDRTLRTGSRIFGFCKKTIESDIGNEPRTFKSLCRAQARFAIEISDTLPDGT